MSNEEINKAISSIPNEMISLFDVYLPMIVPEVTIEEYKVNKGDILFICSDGISDWVRLEEFILILDSNISLNECLKIIMDLVEKRCDTNSLDIKVVVYNKSSISVSAKNGNEVYNIKGDREFDFEYFKELITRDQQN